MTLPSHKKLRTTVRSPRLTTTPDASNRHGSWLQPWSCWRSLPGLTILSACSLAVCLALLQPTAAQASPQAQPANGYQNYLSAKTEYESALRAQMRRAQAEQGAPSDFADKAFAATKAYLDATEEKSYRSGMQPPATAAQASSMQGSNRPETKRTSIMPPVHVAPTAQSSPPPVPSRSAPQVATRTRRSYAPTASMIPSNRGNETGSGLKRTGYVSTTPARRSSGYPRYQTPQKAQPLYVPDNQKLSPPAGSVPPSTLPRMVRRAAEFTPAGKPQVHPATMNQPARAPVLAGPQDFQPITAPSFQAPVPARQAPLSNNLPTRLNPTALPNKTSSPARIAAPKPQQVSVLVNRSAAIPRQEDANAFQGTRPPQSLPMTQPQQDLTQPQRQDNQALEALPRQQVPTEDRSNDNAITNPQESAAESQFQRQMENLRNADPNEESSQDMNGAAEETNDDDAPEREPLANCADFRDRLLGSSIRDIALDISPPASRIRDQFVAISRSWTDRSGNIIATGTMVDLRRGYVIIQTNTGLQKIPYAKLSDADWSAVADYWRIPELCSVDNSAPTPRMWTPQTVTWHASALCHKPLYFENRQLERYGHTHGPVLQPIHSTAHFFVSLFALPYKTAIHPPSECMYALGYYRPGNCAPWLKDPVPISLDGVRRQALVVSAFSFIP